MNDTMRLVYLSIVIGLCLGINILAWWWQATMKRRLAGLEVIRDQASLDLFKWAIAREMYICLIIIAMAIAAIGVFLVGLWGKYLTGADLAFILSLVFLFTIGGSRLKKYETELAQLPVDGPELKAERDRVVYVWRHCALADW